MDDNRVRLITRDEIALGLRESKTPGKEVIFGAIGGVIQQAIDAKTHAQAFDWSAGIKAAVIGAILLWVARFVLNVWRAPRVIATEDRKALESSYERLRSQHENARRELAKHDAKANRIALRNQLAVFLAEGQRFMGRCQTEDGTLLEAEANEWNAGVIAFLRLNFDEGHIALFQSGAGLLPLTVPTKSEAYLNLWRGLRIRVVRLEQFLAETKRED
jgi:hypothetical protein